MTDEEKALRLDRARDAAVDHMLYDRNDYSTFDECLSDFQQIKTGEEWIQIVAGDFDIDKVKAQHDEDYALAQGAIRIMVAALFQNDQEITDDEFATDHWQTLFAIQHPEARS